VFNIAGNKYRLVVWINYPYRVVYIRFIETHRQYDMIDSARLPACAKADRALDDGETRHT